MALARRRHSPDEIRFGDTSTQTWTTQVERDRVALAVLAPGDPVTGALARVVGPGTALHCSVVPIAERESFALASLAGDKRRAAIARWSTERRVPLHLALRRFDPPEQPGDIVATRAEL